MTEHLKNFAAGLAVVLVTLALMFVVVWIASEWGDYVMFAVAGIVVLAIIYWIGYGVRKGDWLEDLTHD